MRYWHHWCTLMINKMKFNGCNETIESETIESETFKWVPSVCVEDDCSFCTASCFPVSTVWLSLPQIKANCFGHSVIMQETPRP